MKRRALVGFGLLVLGLAGGLGYRSYSRAAPETLVVSRGEINQTIVSSGQVMPPAQVRIDSLASGVVQELKYREGDEVKAGELIVRLDDDELKAAVAQGKAAVAQARAGKTGLRRTTLPQATEARNQARTNLKFAQVEYTRQKKLFDSGVVSRAAVDQSRSQRDVFESQVKAAELQVKAASSGGTSSATASAAISVALAQLAAAEATLKRATIRAPIAGVITERRVELGESVRPGSPLVVVTATGRTRIVLEPDERNLALLELGQKATVSAEAFPDKSFQATLSYIAPAVNAERGTIEVRLDVPDPPGYLRPNMTVSVELQIRSRRGAVALPLTVVRDLASSRPWVGVLGPRRKIFKRPVLIGLRGDRQVEIIAGLRAGEQVVLDPPKDAKLDKSAPDLAAPAASAD